MAVSLGFALWRAGCACTQWVQGDPQGHGKASMAVQWPSLLALRAKNALVLGDLRVTTPCKSRDWSAIPPCGITVKPCPEGRRGRGRTGWICRAVLLRKAGTSPVLDQGIVLVSMVAAIALGAAGMSMSRCWCIWPQYWGAQSGPTVRHGWTRPGFGSCGTGRGMAAEPAWTRWPSRRSACGPGSRHSGVMACL